MSRSLSHKSFLERNRKLIARYGITQSDYQIMLAEQNFSCAICNSVYSGRVGSFYFVVDHCHETGRVRGLLCHRCNISLGRISDSVEWLQAAIYYLQGKKSKP
jgi:hypothetical protein